MVKTNIQPSPIEGLGLFAGEDIAAGTVIWKNDPQLSYVTFSDEEWSKLKAMLSPESYRQIRKYSYRFKKDNLIYINLDDTRFFNHSETPNVGGESIDDIALRHIKKGEELLIDYRAFYDEDWLGETMHERK